MTTTSTRDLFIDGYSPRKGVLGIVAYPHSQSGTDAEITTFYMVRDGQWGHQTFPFNGRSATYVTADGHRWWWVLGKRGELARLGLDGIVMEQIPGVGTGPGMPGYVNRILALGSELYVCGYRRQVYVRRHGRWERLDQDIRDTRADADSGFEAIDGPTPECLYAVGNNGEIWRFDGAKWHQCASPTNVDLNEVRCLDGETVYVCGQFGTVLVGRRDEWQVINNPDFSSHLWGIEVFNREVYVAGFGGIAKLVGSSLEPIDTGLGRKIPSYRLRSGDGILWSIGNHDVLSYDGNKWTELALPSSA